MFTWWQVGEGYSKMRNLAHPASRGIHSPLKLCQCCIETYFDGYINHFCSKLFRNIVQFDMLHSHAVAGLDVELLSSSMDDQNSEDFPSVDDDEMFVDDDEMFDSTHTRLHPLLRREIHLLLTDIPRYQRSSFNEPRDPALEARVQAQFATCKWYSDKHHFCFRIVRKWSHCWNRPSTPPATHSHTAMHTHAHTHTHTHTHTRTHTHTHTCAHTHTHTCAHMRTETACKYLFCSSACQNNLFYDYDPPCKSLFCSLACQNNLFTIMNGLRMLQPFYDYEPAANFVTFLRLWTGLQMLQPFYDYNQPANVATFLRLPACLSARRTPSALGCSSYSLSTRLLFILFP